MREAPPCASVRLGSLEAQVMEILWDCGPQAVRGVINELPGNPAYTTIATVLSNLVRKELVEATRGGGSTTYSAVLGRDEYAACVMARRLATVAKDRPAALRHFLEFLSDDDLAAIGDALLAQVGCLTNPVADSVTGARG